MPAVLVPPLDAGVPPEGWSDGVGVTSLLAPLVPVPSVAGGVPELSAAPRFVAGVGVLGAGSSKRGMSDGISESESSALLQPHRAARGRSKEQKLALDRRIMAAL
jgi:hypothetical protein